MPDVRILPAEDECKFRPEYGDLIVDADEMLTKRYMESVAKNALLPYCGLLGAVPWKTCQQLGIDIEWWMRATQRRCPLLKVDYHFSVPVAISTPNEVVVEIPREYPFLSTDWTVDRKAFGGDRLQVGDIAHIHRAILGSGFTYGTLPHDGSNDLYMTMHQLSNGWRMHCATWVWLNK